MPSNKKQNKINGASILPNGWEQKTLGEISLKFLNGGTPSTQKPEYWEGDIPWITGADFANQRIAQVRRYINADAIKNSATNLIPKGWLLVVTRTGVGKMTVAPFDVAISQDITGVQVDSKFTSSEFLFHLLEFNVAKLSSLNQGTSINGITRDVLENIKLSLPTIKEQKKIISILDSCDRAIEITGQLIIAKEKQKRALMLRIFGEFPKKYKWPTMLLPDIARKEKGAIKIGPFGSQLKKDEFVEVGYKVYDQETTFTNDFSYGNNYISEEKFKTLQSCQVHTGDVLISMMGTIGSVAIVPKNAPKGILNSHLLRISPDFKMITSEFLKLTIADSPFTQTQLKRKSHGGIMAGLSATIVKSVKISVPPLKQQEKITSVVGMADKEIQLLRDKLSTLKKKKRGLMQKLLTGKKRVKV